MVVVHTQLVERERTIDGEWKFDWMSSCGGCAYTTGRERVDDWVSKLLRWEQETKPYKVRSEKW